MLSHLNGVICVQANQVIAFDNLSGDARLVVPCASAASHAPYGHIAAFMRSAPLAQRRAFWAAVGANLADVLAKRRERPTWLNTEGSGVPWLHVRMDSRPKYYHYAGYKKWPIEGK